MLARRALVRMLATTVLLAGIVAPAYAAEANFGGAHTHLDARYSHNQYYPTRGYATRALPAGGVAINHAGGRYWYGGGVWWAARGPRWVVVGPPFGVFVPFLPAVYTTVWFGGVPYYYANDAYYVWRDPERGYEVVAPPGEAASTEPPAPEDVFMYPSNGQSADQQARDRYECHRWAADQSAFDPTQPDGGAASGDTAARRGDYFRAMTACLEGRGYNVK